MAETSLIPKSKIEQFEAMLLQLPQVHLPITHEFCNGLYARTMFIPEGTALTGAIHREENFLVIRCGDISVWTEQGMKRLKTGDIVLSGEGHKRIGYAHSDTLLTTFHANPTNETDPELLWELFTVEDASEIEHEVFIMLGAEQ